MHTCTDVSIHYKHVWTLEFMLRAYYIYIYIYIYTCMNTRICIHFVHTYTYIPVYNTHAYLHRQLRTLAYITHIYKTHTYMHTACTHIHYARTYTYIHVYNTHAYTIMHACIHNT